MTFFVVPTIGAIGEVGTKIRRAFDEQSEVQQSHGGRLRLDASWQAYPIRGWMRGQEPAWVRSDFATGLSIGAGFALVGFVFGMLVRSNDQSHGTTWCADTGANLPRNSSRKCRKPKNNKPRIRRYRP